MRWTFVIAALVALFLSAGSGRSQELATLVADNITVDPKGRVTATGNVQVFYDGTMMSAAAVSYDQNGNRLTITGPIQVTDNDGTTFFANAAELDRDLRDGVLTSARMVLDQQLQIAATEIARVDDRYTRLDRVVASSCEVCAANPTPLWEIRASRVIHDEVERQLYFSNAQLRMIGVPVMYLPRLRLPDPTLKRATGFLIPELKTSSDLGTGIKVPYFFAFGEHRDLTLTPYVSGPTTTLEFKYRQEHSHGQIEAIGAASKDNIDGSRGYLFANASYRLPRNFLLEAQVEFASDPGYLFTYDYSDKDRLTNQIAILRVRNKDLFRSEITEFRTLREDEIPIRPHAPGPLCRHPLSTRDPGFVLRWTHFCQRIIQFDNPPLFGGCGWTRCQPAWRRPGLVPSLDFGRWLRHRDRAWASCGRLYDRPGQQLRYATDAGRPARGG